MNRPALRCVINGVDPAAQLSGITAEQAAADGQKFPGRESGFRGVASFTE
jgi:hypothetical protein